MLADLGDLTDKPHYVKQETKGSGLNPHSQIVLRDGFAVRRRGEGIKDIANSTWNFAKKHSGKLATAAALAAAAYDLHGSKQHGTTQEHFTKANAGKYYMPVDESSGSRIKDFADKLNYDIGPSLRDRLNSAKVNAVHNAGRWGIKKAADLILPKPLAYTVKKAVDLSAGSGRRRGKGIVSSAYRKAANFYRRNFCPEGTRMLENGEWHPGCANYIGPGTRTDIPEVMAAPAYNATDEAARLHDLAYADSYWDPDSIFQADENFEHAVGNIRGEEPYRTLALTGIRAKRAADRVYSKIRRRRSTVYPRRGSGVKEFFNKHKSKLATAAALGATAYGVYHNNSRIANTLHNAGAPGYVAERFRNTRDIGKKWE